MNALALKKGASRHSAYDFHDPFHGPERSTPSPSRRASSPNAIHISVDERVLPRSANSYPSKE